MRIVYSFARKERDQWIEVGARFGIINTLNAIFDEVNLNNCVKYGFLTAGTLTIDFSPNVTL